MLQYALVRPPGNTFTEGLTTAMLGFPDVSLAIRQHEAYCRALESCGIHLIQLEPDDHYPDSTFVEDTAILTFNAAIITNPGADPRKGETIEINQVLSDHFLIIHRIMAPGTLDGGDVLEADGHYFIGITKRTNPYGAGQLAEFLKRAGHDTSMIDIRGIRRLLHLKSGISYLGSRDLVAIPELANLEEFEGFHILQPIEKERYAANCINVNGQILLPEGFPDIQREITHLGYPVITLGMSEFQKMDGGLSCLSLRF